MVSPLDDPSMIQHNDRVAVADGGQTVGDHKYGAPLHQIVHTFLHNTLGSGINTGGCLV